MSWLKRILGGATALGSLVAAPFRAGATVPGIFAGAAMLAEDINSSGKRKGDGQAAAMRQQALMQQQGQQPLTEDAMRRMKMLNELRNMMRGRMT